MRIDKLLWFLRLTKTRGVAQAMVAAGHLRLNGRRVERSAQPVAIGDVLTLPLPAGVKVIEVLAMPLRRGPAREAQACYRRLDEPAANPIAGPASAVAREGDLQP
ncbi:MAG: RNA-binding S4 domain-containing protein [Novosphingobium sp.]|nr:RNA-binding S4 domain-containing protein [Novosphingobium sp.]